MALDGDPAAAGGDRDARSISRRPCLIEQSVVVFEGPLNQIKNNSHPFLLDCEGMLAGRVRALAEIVDPAAGMLISRAWSDPIDVGFRKAASASAANGKSPRWSRTASLINGRPKAWKLPEMGTAMLPGPLINDEWFRGWVTVAREVKWNKSGDLRPRFVRLSNLTDSATVSIDGVALPETRPIEEMAVLSHWIEFHSRYKGEANAQTRMLFLDQWPQGKVNLALPSALPAEGSAQVEIRVRGTSGSFRPHPLPAIRGDLHLDLTGPVYVKSISFDTEKPGENRRFKFALSLGNDTGKEFRGTLRAVYGRYDGKIPYTGNCPAYATVDQPIVLQPGTSEFVGSAA